MGCSPMTLAFCIHFVIVPGDTPYLLAAVRTPCRVANCAASRRTLGAWGFEVYDMCEEIWLSVSTLLNHYDRLDK